VLLEQDGHLATVPDGLRPTLSPTELYIAAGPDKRRNSACADERVAGNRSKALYKTSIVLFPGFFSLVCGCYHGDTIRAFCVRLTRPGGKAARNRPRGFQRPVVPHPYIVLRWRAREGLGRKRVTYSLEDSAGLQASRARLADSFAVSD